MSAHQNNPAWLVIFRQVSPYAADQGEAEDLADDVFEALRAAGLLKGAGR